MLLAVVLSILLSACGQQSPQDVLEDYRWRMGNVLKVPIVEAEHIFLPRFPRQRELTLAIPPQKINLLQFLRLSQCELQRLLGERNSNLGRLMPASQQLKYQQQFMRMAQACLSYLESLGESEDLQTALRNALISKRKFLPSLSWNATFAGPEFQSLFGGASAPLALTAVMPSELLAKIADLANQLRLETGADWAQLERQLQVIGSESYAGLLLSSQALLIRELAPVTTALKTSAEANTLCPRGVATPQAKILQNVFFKYYVAGVQPYLATVHQQSRALQHELEALRDNFTAVEPLVFVQFWEKSWDASSDSVWRLFEAQIRAHTLAWQAVLKSCNMMPK